MKLKTTYLLVFLFSITAAKLCSQSVIPKGLQSLLQLPDDTNKVNQLVEQARMFTPGILQLGDELSDSAMVVAQKINYQEGLIQAQRTKAQVATFRGNIDLAVHWYDRALELCGQNPQFKKNKISMILSKGIVYFLEGKIQKAVDLYLEAEKMCNDPEYDDLLGKAYNNLAMAYRKQENYESAIEIYQKSIPLKEAGGDKAGLATVYNNLGVAHAFLDDHPTAINYLSRSKELFEQLGRWKEVSNVQLSQAASLYELERKQEAKALLSTAFGEGDLNLPFYDLMQGKLLFARLWLEEEQYREAEKYLQELSPQIERTPFLESLKDYLLLRATASYGLSKVGEAYQLLTEYNHLRDTLVKSERSQLEEAMNVKYQTKEKEDQVALQSMQLARDQREKWIFIVVLFALLAILGLGISLYLQRQKANRLLSTKNAVIEKSLAEKEILLKEIHHRVKNNLQIISSLLNLQSRQIDDPKALEAIREGRNRVASMALIHKNLYQEDDLTGVNAADYIDKLTDSLMSSYQVSDHEVRFEKDIDPVQLDVDVVIPLGLILNEIITNCLKYAFPEGQPGLIRMSLKEQENGIHLNVSDNGKGLPAGFEVEELNSLGFRLIKAFAQKLEAALNISSQFGTQIEVVIPNHKIMQYADHQSAYSGG